MCGLSVIVTMKRNDLLAKLVMWQREYIFGRSLPLFVVVTARKN